MAHRPAGEAAAAPSHLLEHVRAEPLVNGFRAWPHLVAPHTYCVILRDRHLTALREGIAAAGRDGDQRRRAHLEGLLGAVTADRPHLLRFGEQILALDALMLREARGFRLDELYERVPDGLRGFVELFYGRYNDPGVRFLEPALYRSPLYDPTLQAVSLRASDPDQPGDGMRVPRSPGRDGLIAPAPFASGVWDLLGRARRAGTPGGELADALGVRPAELEALVAADGPGTVPVPPPDGPRVRFFGHACVLIEDGHSSVLVDPLVAYRRAGTADRFSFADLPERIDCLAITHAHLDHLDIETLLQLRHLVGEVIVPRAGAGDLVDPSLRLVLEAIGFHHVRELDDFESHEIAGGGLLTAVPFFGEHADLPIRGKSGYAVRLQGRTCVMLADSRCLEPRIYEHARDLIGPVAALFIGMECEGSPLTTANAPYLPEGLYTAGMAESRRTNASDAAGALQVLDALRPERAYVYAMGLEPWLSYMFGVPDPTKTYSLSQVEVFERECSRRAVPARLLRGAQVLELGGAS
ncbi:MBL fold metallo-hydrolase [Dactylosporangium sp. CA-139114]|uniref:MBL fold metallo-hydrolase n=1 Tax=Dactylosporangium sp. CA-139114 TaxID=3239931 RepID=UPI003D965B7A